MPEDEFVWSLFTSCARVFCGGLAWKEKKTSLSSPVVNTYRTYFGVEPESVSLLSFSQISCSPEIRKLSVKRSPPPHGTHFASSHPLSSLFVFCLFVFTFCFWHCSPGRTSSFAMMLNDVLNMLLCKETKVQKHYLWNIKLTHSHKNNFSPAVAACVIRTEVILRREVADFCMTPNCSVARVKQH